MRLVRKLYSLSARERRDLFRAQWALWRAQWHIRSRPTGTLLGAWSTDSILPIADAKHLVRAHQIGDAVRRTALFGFSRPQCLARSLAICELLEAEHIPGAIVRVGVRPHEDAIAAHAWVEFAGDIVGDSRAHVRAFALLATAQDALHR